MTLVDVSSSIGQEAFTNDWVVLIAEVQRHTRVGFGANQSRHALVSFASSVTEVYALNSSANTDYPSLRDATEGVQYDGGITKLSLGLDALITAAQSAIPRASPAEKVVLIYTDGTPTPGFEANAGGIDRAAQLEALGFTIVIVGIGDLVNEADLAAVSSNAIITTYNTSNLGDSTVDAIATILCTVAGSFSPTAMPTSYPSTSDPTSSPSTSPSMLPTKAPTQTPSLFPTTCQSVYPGTDQAGCDALRCAMYAQDPAQLSSSCPESFCSLNDWIAGCPTSAPTGTPQSSPTQLPSFAPSSQLPTEAPTPLQCGIDQDSSACAQAFAASESMCFSYLASYCEATCCGVTTAPSSSAPTVPAPTCAPDNSVEICSNASLVPSSCVQYNQVTNVWSFNNDVMALCPTGCCGVELPSSSPTEAPTYQPTVVPSTSEPTIAPSSGAPTASPSAAPSDCSPLILQEECTAQLYDAYSTCDGLNESFTGSISGDNPCSDTACPDIDGYNQCIESVMESAGVNRLCELNSNVTAFALGEMCACTNCAYSPSPTNPPPTSAMPTAPPATSQPSMYPTAVPSRDCGADLADFCASTSCESDFQVQACPTTCNCGAQGFAGGEKSRPEGPEEEESSGSSTTATAVLASVLVVAILGAAYLVNSRTSSYRFEKANTLELGWDSGDVAEWRREGSADGAHYYPEYQVANSPAVISDVGQSKSYVAPTPNGGNARSGAHYYPYQPTTGMQATGSDIDFLYIQERLVPEP